MSIIVNKVRIKNFRSLSNIETTLGEMTLLLGANNSGRLPNYLVSSAN